MRERISRVTLADLVAAAGLAALFWEPIYGLVLVGLGFAGKAITAAFPPAELPTAILEKRTTDLEERLGRLELRIGMHR